MLVFCIQFLKYFSNAIVVVSVPGLSYLGQIMLLFAVPFQVLRCLSDNTDPRRHNNTQEMATDIVYMHIYVQL